MRFDKPESRPYTKPPWAATRAIPIRSGFNILSMYPMLLCRRRDGPTAWHKGDIYTLGFSTPRSVWVAKLGPRSWGHLIDLVKPMERIVVLLSRNPGSGWRTGLRVGDERGLELPGYGGCSTGS